MTVSRDEIRTMVARYLDAHPERSLEMLPLRAALKGSDDPTSRSTFPLHITCSAAAINPAGRVLMIHHRALNRWLLPGGHIEPDDRTLYGAALRELEEETGIAWQQAVFPPTHDLAPVDVDVHEIPANPAKGEPDHLHADFRFAFWVAGADVSLQVEEVTAAAWRHASDLPTPRLVASVSAI